MLLVIKVIEFRIYNSFFGLGILEFIFRKNCFYIVVFFRCEMFFFSEGELNYRGCYRSCLDFLFGFRNI